MAKKRKRIHIDKTDIEIMRILYENGRESLVSIGKQVNLTHPSIKERLKKIIGAEIVKVQANINIRKMGLSVGFVFMDITDPQTIRDIMKELIDCPRVLMIGCASGTYNLILIVVAPNPNILRAFIEKNLRPLPNVRRLDFSLGEILVPKFLPLKTVSEKKCGEKCEECLFKKTLNLCPGCLGILEEMKMEV